MVFNETIDTTTLAMVNLSKIFIGDLSTSFTNGVDAVSICAVSVTVIDAVTIRIQMTESQRVAAMYLGNTTIAGDAPRPY